MAAFPLYRFLVTTFIALTLTNSVNTADRSDFDGVHWKKMSASQRVLYVKGLSEGMNYGRWALRLDLIQESTKNPPKGIAAKVMEDWATNFAAESLLKENTKFNRISIGQTVAGVNKMYADYRNQQIPIVSLVEVVVDSINGASIEETERRLSDIRKEIAEGNSRQQ